MRLNNEQYWENRSLEKEEKYFKLAEKLGKELNKTYSSALNDIKKEIAYFYSKYAIDGVLNYADAMKYKRLDSLMNSIKDIIFKLNGYEQTSIEDLLTNIYTGNYYETIYTVQKGLNLGFNFAKVNPGVIKEVLLTPWSGQNYSENLYDNRNLLVRNIKKTLTNGFIRGDSNQKMASSLSKNVDTSYKNAIRIVRTETTYVANNASIKGYEECSVDQYKYLATLDSRTSSICKRLDGKIFYNKDAQTGKNLPSMHPNCRSTTIPYFGQNIEERIARDKNGKTYYIDGKLNYNDWYEKYVTKE